MGAAFGLHPVVMEDIVNTHKHEMILLRRAIWLLWEEFSHLERGDSTLIHSSTHIYLRDVYDHTIQLIETTETYRDMLVGMMDIYLTSLSNRLNETMKVLFVIATIFIPLDTYRGDPWDEL
ncbi:MAG: hypothetical protein MRJ67_03490 [Nitrospirales bacterium]|nr:hypothetical protein [Nitrospirales bacterium]